MTNPSNEHKLSHPIVISYYTPNTAYEEHAMMLQDSLKALNLAFRIEPRPSRPTWVENCAQKARFVQEMLTKERRPVLWIDADALLLRPFSILENCSADFAIVSRKGWNFTSAQCYFAPTQQGLQLVDKWVKYCEAYPHIWDQVSLGYAWWDTTLDGKLSVEWLPESIFTKELKVTALRPLQRLFTKACVLQKQESRTTKKTQARPAHAEFGNKHLPLWWREAAIARKPFKLTAEQRTALGLLNDNPG